LINVKYDPLDKGRLVSRNILAPETLNKRRIQAVKLRLSGLSLDATQQLTGLSHPTIIAAHKAFLNGGWAGVIIKKRGRPKEDNNKPEIQALWRQMHAQPEEIWNLEKAHKWLTSKTELAISRKTLSRYIQECAIKPAKETSTAFKNTNKAHNYFIRTITTCAQRKKKHSDDRKTFALCAQKSKGELQWQCFYDYLTEATLLSFIQNIIKQHDDGKKIYITIESAPLAHYSIINTWLKEQQKLKLIVVDSNNADTTKQQENPIVASSIQPSYVRNPMPLTHLERLEAESIQIMREVISKTENPVMLYSVGKDSAVMLHLAMKAFYPSKPPFPFLHVDTGWKFRDMYEFRDNMVKDLGIELIIYKNLAGEKQGINPFTHGSALHTDIMKTQGLKQALDKYKFDAAFGGARRDEEKSRAKERIFSFRTADHRWDPKNQRPELWKNYNANKKPGESIRVFPISNWTELDIWQYIYLEKIPVVPLYLSAKRPVVERDGMLVMVDDERMPMQPGEVPMMRDVRFRTLGCYPLTGAVESTANTLPEIIQEMLLTRTSERLGRMIDKDSFASMEKKKQEGYF